MKTLSKTLKGIGVGLGLLGGVLATDKADAGYMYIDSDSSVSSPYVTLAHWPGSDEGYDSIDNSYLEAPSPIIDFFAVANGWTLPNGETRLNLESHPVDSYTPFHLELWGRGLSAPVSTDISFDIILDDWFQGKPMYADITTPDGTPVYNNINIWDADANGTKFTLNNITDGHMYNVDVRFTEVPIAGAGWFLLSGLAGLGGLGGARRVLSDSKKRHNKNK